MRTSGPQKAHSDAHDYELTSLHEKCLSSHHAVMKSLPMSYQKIHHQRKRLNCQKQSDSHLSKPEACFSEHSLWPAEHPPRYSKELQMPLSELHATRHRYRWFFVRLTYLTVYDRRSTRN